MNSTVHSNLQTKVAADKKKWTLKISAISNRYYLWTLSLRISFVAFITMRKISKSCLRMKTNLWQGPHCRRSSMSSHQSANRSSLISCQWRHRLSWSDPRAQGHLAAPVIPNLRYEEKLVTINVPCEYYIISEISIQKQQMLETILVYDQSIPFKHFFCFCLHLLQLFKFYNKNANLDCLRKRLSKYSESRLM